MLRRNRRTGPGGRVEWVSIGRASGFRNAGEKGIDMFKHKAPDNDQDAVANEQAAARPQPTKAETSSCIGSGMSIVGKIECNGPAQVFGRIEGELRASDLLIGDGAQIEGSVIAQDITVCGRVKGTIRAVRVRLQGGGAVEGDIFHRSLSIDESSLFEGSSRRVENPTEPASSVDANGPQKKSMQNPTPAPLPSIDADLQRH